MMKSEWAAGVFSLLRGVVLRPLPFARPEQLVMLWETNKAKALEHEPISQEPGSTDACG